ncbi:MAG: hypothetical protein H8F28_14810 [Fibrella sp.]|nr:hypothetical protein [Armatimonadota bacterium]
MTGTIYSAVIDGDVRVASTGDYSSSESRVHHYTPDGVWRSTLDRPATSICCDPRYANRVALFSENGMAIYEVI